MTDARVHSDGDDAHVRMAISGEIDLANAATVERDILAALTNHVSAVSLDITDLAYLDSAGLRVLFSLTERLRLAQIDLDLIAAQGCPARRVVQLAGLDAVVPLHPR